jgi:serine protease Do
VREPRELNRQIASSTIGDVIKLVVWRDGAVQTIPISIAEFQPDKATTEPAASKTGEATRASPQDLGLVLSPITENARAKFGVPPQQTGVVVQDVLANSPAADRGITAGSLILNVHRRSVTSPVDVRAGIDAAREESRNFVLLLVENKQGLRWVALPLGTKP